MRYQHYFLKLPLVVSWAAWFVVYNAASSLQSLDDVQVAEVGVIHVTHPQRLAVAGPLGQRGEVVAAR